MAGAHRDVAGIARLELLRDRLAPAEEDGYLRPTALVVLPLVRVGVPVKLAQSARLELDHRPRHLGRDRELVDRDGALGPAAGAGRGSCAMSG